MFWTTIKCETVAVFLFLVTFIYFILGWEGNGACYGSHVEVRVKYAGIDSLLLPC